MTNTLIVSPISNGSGGGGSGNATSIQNVPVDPATPTTGEVLIFNGTEWIPAPAPSGSFSAGGDLSGTSTDQTVIAINGASVPVSGSLTTGNALQVSGTSSLEYGPINLAGGTNYVIGDIPAGNLPVATTTELGIIELSNDISGTATSVIVQSSYGVPVLAYNFMMMGA